MVSNLSMVKHLLNVRQSIMTLLTRSNMARHHVVMQKGITWNLADEETSRLHVLSILGLITFDCDQVVYGCI